MANYFSSISEGAIGSEREVVRFVGEGVPNQKISHKLNLREHTVQTRVPKVEVVFVTNGLAQRPKLTLYPCCS